MCNPKVWRQMALRSLSLAFPGLGTHITTEETTRQQRLASLQAPSEADFPPVMRTGLDLGAQGPGSGHWLA